MIRPQRNMKFLPQTEKWFVGDDVCIVPNDGLYRIYYHIIPRTTVGAQCVPLRVGYALRQHRIILSADTASEVRQMLSQKRR